MINVVFRNSKTEWKVKKNESITQEVVGVIECDQGMDTNR